MDSPESWRLFKKLNINHTSVAMFMHCSYVTAERIPYIHLR
ncbi:hypothetical protein BIFCAT_01691 [Bifidobacterium catenulatum DSM 16992 = JCM 1194 = LMG 11043]|uniref:Uncharacterized protein n=1 Tax=Bifidobacterium catenulatum DSM 16992 = JCM 1194 = LMG 11043 TaxID=566552 RepID=B6XWN0_9BIFI|nr:hypothetical protein BIFCAT_01691 [Bifidobacterium catenulatum DSM 16992 = JCM 1194 = LMG 11043]